MKQRTTAVIEHIDINGTPINLAGKPKVELEFSAIDTGGGFHDPILDFAYTVEPADNQPAPKNKQSIRLQISDPYSKENRLTVAYEGHLNETGEHKWEGMGRLKDNAVSRKMMAFVMRAVRRRG